MYVSVNYITFSCLGMADYQVIQPGLNNMTHKGLPLERNPKLIMIGLFNHFISNATHAGLYTF